SRRRVRRHNGSRCGSDARGRTAGRPAAHAGRGKRVASRRKAARGSARCRVMPREAKQRKAGVVWRITLIAAGLIAAGVCSAMAGLKVRDYTLTDPQFRLARGRQGSLTVEGLQHTSRLKVQRVFAADFDHSIFAIPLAERRRRLLAIDWVEDASV